MGCIPFCCCLKNFSPKVFAFITLGCEGLKIILSILSIVFIPFGVVLGGIILNALEFFPSLAYLIQIILITVFIFNGSAFDKKNSCCKVMCIVIFVISSIRILLKIISFILLIYSYTLVDEWLEEKRISGPTTKDWLGFLVPYILYLIIEVTEFLSMIYIYKLLKLKSNVSYLEYLKNGQNVEQVSVTVTNAQISQTPPILPNQSTPSSQQKVLN